MIWAGWSVLRIEGIVIINIYRSVTKCDQSMPCYWNIATGLALMWRTMPEKEECNLMCL